MGGSHLQYLCWLKQVHVHVYCMCCMYCMYCINLTIKNPLFEKCSAQLITLCIFNERVAAISSYMYLLRVDVGTEFKFSRERPIKEDAPPVAKEDAPPVAKEDAPPVA